MTSSATPSANPLRALAKAHQSPWLDFIRRSFVEDGSLARLVQDDDIRGVTSNPAIFQKAMGEGTEYDAQMRDILAHEIVSPGVLYEKLAVTDIKAAARVLAPVYEQARGKDGFVSLEVSPYLARDRSRARGTGRPDEHRARHRPDRNGRPARRTTGTRHIVSPQDRLSCRSGTPCTRKRLMEGRTTHLGRATKGPRSPLYRSPVRVPPRACTHCHAR